MNDDDSLFLPIALVHRLSVVAFHAAIVVIPGSLPSALASGASCLLVTSKGAVSFVPTDSDEAKG